MTEFCVFRFSRVCLSFSFKLLFHVPCISVDRDSFSNGKGCHGVSAFVVNKPTWPFTFISASNHFENTAHFICFPGIKGVAIT